MSMMLCLLYILTWATMKLRANPNPLYVKNPITTKTIPIKLHMLSESASSPIKKGSEKQILVIGSDSAWKI
jgi:hypothetical protein